MSHDTAEDFIHGLQLVELQEYSLQGQDTISKVAHPDFEFVRDGWVAAAAICKFYGHQDVGHESLEKRAASHAVDLLLTKKVHLDDIALEEFAVVERREGLTKREYVPHVVDLTKQFWKEVCRRGGDAANSVEVIRERAARDSWPSPQHAKLRIQRPFPYPIPQASKRSLFGFVRLLDDHLVPKSAIFFAVRLRVLSHLADGLYHVEPGSDEEEHGTMEIYSVLLCMLAYYLGIAGAKAAPNDEEFDLGFYRQIWLDTYYRCGKRGSRALGLDGYRHHRDFLMTREQDLLRWCEGAIRWWIPEGTLKGTTQRKILRDQLMKMMKGLYKMMGIAMNLHSSPPLPTRPDIDMLDLFDNFELAEKQTIAGVKHSGFNFVSDGWAAAIKLADKWNLEGDDDLGQRSLPHEIEIKHRLTDLRGGGKFNLPVQTRQPLALPFTSSEAKYLVHPIHYRHSTHFVPQSAIFFASRLFRLRELVRNLEIANSGLAKCRAGHQDHNEHMQRKQELLKEIYGVLLSASLYMAAMLRDNSEKRDIDGIDKLGYYAETWLELYGKGTARGSEIFGMKDGFGLNGEFLLEYRKDLSVWGKEATHRWCPGNTKDDEIKRAALGDALELMKKELFEMYAEMFNLIKAREKRPDGIGPLPEENPFTPSPPASPFIPIHRF